MSNENKIILSLCDYSGNWSHYYRTAGYDVRLVDLKHGSDVRLYPYIDKPVYGILAAPPCTAFTVSGAQYWQAKDEDGTTLDALALVDACLRMVAIYQPIFWALENPVGRLSRWIGKPKMYFNPCDFGGYVDGMDAYTKKTGLWGKFNKPKPNPVEPEFVIAKNGDRYSKIHWFTGGKTERTKEIRSVTPLGFAKAFFEANQ